MVFTIPEVLVRLRPGAKWRVKDIHDYESIEWNDTSQTKPSIEECENMFVQLKSERIMDNIRTHRNTLLEKTDKYIVADFPHPSEEVRQAWLDYRQALRDLPANTTDPENPVWPQAPN